MQVLVLLAAHAGQVVAKERLMQTVWPDTFVTDDVLTRAISELRRVFGDDAKESRFIQTIPKSGYRLIARVSPSGAERVRQPLRRRSVGAQTAGRSEHGGASWKLGLWAISLAAVMRRGCRGAELAGRRRPGARESRSPCCPSNTSGDPEREYLTDGLTEETSASLGQIDPEHLSVKGRTSTRRYKQHFEVARGDRSGAGRRVSGGRVRSGRERPAARDGEADSRARPGADMGGVLRQRAGKHARTATRAERGDRPTGSTAPLSGAADGPGASAHA